MRPQNNTKLKLSISIEESLLAEIEKYIASSVFRNRSHFIELAVKRLIENGRQSR